MTSTWITRAPASITSATCAPSAAKSAERIDGATRRARAAASVARRGIVSRDVRSGGASSAPQCWHFMSSVRLMRLIVWCSPQLGHCETQLEAAAGSRRRRSGPGAGSGAATARRSPGSSGGAAGCPRRPGSAQPRAFSPSPRSPLRAPHAMKRKGHAARRRRAMKNPVVRSRSGRSLQEAAVVAEASAGCAGAEVVSSSGRPFPACRREQCGDPLLVLAAGDRAGRVDQRPARPQRSGRAARASLAWSSASRSIALGDLAPAGVGARGAASRGPSRAGRGGRGRSPPPSVDLGRVGLDHGARRAGRGGAACAGDLVRRAGRPSSTEITSPRSSIRAAIWPVLMPGPAQRSSTCSPGPRVEQPRRPRPSRAICGVSSPASTARAPPRPTLPVDDDHLRRASAAHGARGGRAPRRPRRAAAPARCAPRGRAAC